MCYASSAKPHEEYVEVGGSGFRVGLGEGVGWWGWGVEQGRENLTALKPVLGRGMT